MSIKWGRCWGVPVAKEGDLVHEAKDTRSDYWGTQIALEPEEEQQAYEQNKNTKRKARWVKTEGYGGGYVKKERIEMPKSNKPKINKLAEKQKRYLLRSN